MAVNNTGKQKQHKHKDGREWLGSGTRRSLAWLLILSSKTETMKWLGLNLYVVGCRAARRSLDVLGDTILQSSDEVWGL